MCSVHVHSPEDRVRGAAVVVKRQRGKWVDEVIRSGQSIQQEKGEPRDQSQMHNIHHYGAIIIQSTTNMITLTLSSEGQPPNRKERSGPRRPKRGGLKRGRVMAGARPDGASGERGSRSPNLVAVCAGCV